MENIANNINLMIKVGNARYVAKKFYHYFLTKWMQIRNARMDICGWLGGITFKKVLEKIGKVFLQTYMLWGLEQLKYCREKWFDLDLRNILFQVAQSWDTGLKKSEQTVQLHFEEYLYTYSTTFRIKS